MNGGWKGGNDEQDIAQKEKEKCQQKAIKLKRKKRGECKKNIVRKKA